MNNWLRVIDDELVSLHLGVASGDDTYEEAKRKFKLIIDCCIAIHNEVGSGAKSKLDSSNTAAVDQYYHWLPIDSNTPRGCKLQLINKEAGVAMYGRLTSTNTFFTHWQTLPTFKSSKEQE